jgi:hypothetical protein
MASELNHPLKNQGGSTIVDFDKFGNPTKGETFAFNSMNVLVPSFTEDALRLHQFETGNELSDDHCLRVTFNKGGGVDYQVVSPGKNGSVRLRFA